MAQDDEGLYEAVADRRDYLVSLEKQNEPLYEKVEGTNGKVVRLTRWTKTEGNA
jgi:DNA-directed RNA polymerase subunit H (RpoH/RPB5)